MTAGAKSYPVPRDWSQNAHLDSKAYERLYRQSIDNPEAFWAEQAEEFLSWDRSWDKVLDWHWALDEVRHSWFDGGALNVCHNCVDRHLESRGDQAAIIWEGDDPERSRTLSYRELHVEVCKFANILKHLKIQKKRPRLHLHADDPRGRHRHAGMRPHRRDPFSRLWRLFA